MSDKLLCELVTRGRTGGTSSTLAIRGDIIREANSGKTTIDKVKFTLSSAAQALDAVDLSSTGVVITYLGSGSSSCFWTTNWVIGTGDLVDPGEQVEVTVNLSNMTPILGKTKEFTRQAKLNRGAVIIVNRITPPEFKAVQALE
jgi:archaellin